MQYCSSRTNRTSIATTTTTSYLNKLLAFPSLAPNTYKSAQDIGLAHARHRYMQYIFSS